MVALSEHVMDSAFIRKRRLHDSSATERDYWRARSYAERFRAVELISNPLLAEDAQQEFPRVLKVTHRRRR
jgi:hypothetical protein